MEELFSIRPYCKRYKQFLQWCHWCFCPFFFNYCLIISANWASQASIWVNSAYELSVNNQIAGIVLQWKIIELHSRSKLPLDHKTNIFERHVQNWIYSWFLQLFFPCFSIHIHPFQIYYQQASQRSLAQFRGDETWKVFLHIYLILFIQYIFWLCQVKKFVILGMAWYCHFKVHDSVTFCC